MASENENYTLKNNNDNDNDVATQLDLKASVLTMRPPRLQTTNTEKQLILARTK